MIQDSEDDLQINIGSELIAELAREHDNFRFVKIEGERSVSKMSEVRSITEDKLVMFGGDNGIRLIEEYGVGERGLIGGAFICKLSTEVFRDLEIGETSRAKKSFRKLNIFLQCVGRQEKSWIETEKVALKLLGVIRHSRVRGPAIPLPAEYQAEIRNALETIGLISCP
jgi:dihydrodipicolinate synthase/N-acetylneuraminate lyase